MIGRKLINGSICETAVVNQHTTFFLNNLYINLILNIITENSLVASELISVKDQLTNDIEQSMFTHHIEIPTNSSYSSSATPQKRSLTRTKKKALELVPFDFLITVENINFCLYSQELDKAKLILWAHFIQPHIHLVVHEKIQKFEISIYDFDMKRSREIMPVSADNLPEKQLFLIPVIETKPSEQNSKTGILSSFFSLKIKDFANLFTKSAQPTSLNPINELITNIDMSLMPSETPSESSSVICSCTSCFRCYEFMVNQGNKKATSILGNINSEIFIERPTRVKTNVFLYEQIKQLMEMLNLVNDVHETKANITALDDTKQAQQIPQILFDLNIHVATSQLIIIIECIDIPKADNYLNFSTCIKSLKIHLNQRHESLADINDLRVLPNGVNCINFKINDLQCSFNRNGPVVSERLPFFGPVTINLELTYNIEVNEAHVLVNVGSTSFTMNKSLVECINQIQEFIQSCSYKDVS